MYNRSFRLMLTDETFTKWKSLYPNHGVRQTILRKVVDLMINCAEASHQQSITETMTVFDHELKLLFIRWGAN